MLLAVATFNVT